MALHRYIKAPVGTSQSQSLPVKSRWKKLAPPIMMTLGSVLIANVAWPIISYQLLVAPNIQKTEFISPIDTQDMINRRDGVSPDKGVTVDAAQAPQVLGAEVDYTNARNWFPTANFAEASVNQVVEYVIDIPSLGIEDAKVLIGGDDLDESLIHYPGTSDPGQLGSPVIFGHSILRQFYSPELKNPDRYISIFSKIMTMKHGERIYVDYDGIRYTYEVKDKVEVQPDDLFILQQKYNNRELKLITCTPEGTYLKRGVVIAQLVNLSEKTDSRRQN